MFRPKIGKCSELDDNQGKVHAPRQHPWRGINSTQHMFPKYSSKYFYPAIDPDTFFPKIHPPTPRMSTKVHSYFKCDIIRQVTENKRCTAQRFDATLDISSLMPLSQFILLSIFAKNDDAPPPPPPLP